ncbi:glycoside hydrolase family 43 protein [Sphingobacterium sp.]|uniref:glycoside hydrolase family 43 protein n=1 Tax=Sphingobacterium sp. TaxID=341027 RepID=UPI0028ABD5DD|nr:glycoside hydrolase family 43 protein [Sphingobacterium sp.]
MYNKLISFLATLCFALTASAQQDSAYVFSYFKGNGEDGLHLAYSEDGLKWNPLKNDASFLTPKLSPDKLMRDPCIIKGGDGLYHMVWTVSWTQKGIGHASSKDLINWSEQQYIPVMEHEENTRNSWAPEITYDPESKQYMIYWASTITGEFPETQVEADNGYNHRMYYTLTKDFKTFSETMLLYDPGFNSIDATILKNGNNWMMVIKDETREPKAEKNLKLAFADSLEGPYSDASEKITGDYWAEGPTVAKINGEYYIYFDRYMDNHFGLIKSKDLRTWTDISDQLELPKGLRHGTILKISGKELDKLKAVKP